MQFAHLRQVLSLVQHAIESGIPFSKEEDEEVKPVPDRKLLRRASASSVVLLKNDESEAITGSKLLPIDITKLKEKKGPKDKVKIAVIGPNAYQARISGGGSASLRPSYTVSPLQGIKDIITELGWSAADVEVSGNLGVNAEKYTLLIDPFIRLPGSPESGGQLEFWNSIPSTSFLEPEANLSDPLAEPIWKAVAPSSSVDLVDDVVRVYATHEFTLISDRFDVAR